MRQEIRFRTSVTPSGVTDATSVSRARSSGDGVDAPVGTWITRNGVTWRWNGTNGCADNVSWATDDYGGLFGYHIGYNDADYPVVEAELLDGPGDYRVWLLMPRLSYARTRARIYDGAVTTPLLDVSNSSAVIGDETGPFDVFWDNAGALHNFADVDFVAHAHSVLTFTTNIIRVVSGGHAFAAFTSGIAAFAWEKVASGAAVAPSALVNSSRAGRRSGRVNSGRVRTYSRR